MAIQREVLNVNDSALQPAGGLGDREYFSTSEVASLCRVHKNTIIAAINRGLLPASKTPGGHNRVSRADLASFMRERGIPEGFGTVPSITRVMVVGESSLTVKRIRKSLPSPQFDVFSVQGLFEAGVVSARQRPDVLILPADPGTPDWAKVAHEIRQVAECRQTHLLGLSETGTPVPGAPFEVVLPREPKPGDLLDAITRLIHR